MRDRQAEEAGLADDHGHSAQLAAELRAVRELNRRRGDLLAAGVRDARRPLRALRQLGDFLALADARPERAQELAAEVQRAAMQLENILTDLQGAADLPPPSPPRLEPLPDVVDQVAELRAWLAAERERSTLLESELAAARLAQRQLQSYADDFRRIHAESRQRLQQMAVLYDVSTAIGSTVDPQEVLDRTAEGLARLLPDTALAIYLLDESRRVTLHQPTEGDPGQDVGPLSVAVGEGIVGRCIQRGEAQVDRGDGPGSPRLAPTWRLALPVAVGPGLLGAFLLTRRGAPHFDRDERYLAELVATQTAMALQNARLATTDALTGLFNRRYFERALSFECDRARRVQRSLGLLIADVDHFKRFNERHGHPAGDAVLRQVAATLVTHFRRTDIVARIGGEEFAIILPEDDPEATAVAAERLRRAVEGRPPLHFEGRDLPAVRISVGGASLAGEHVSAEALIRIADGTLRQAKRSGRNRALTRSADGAGVIQPASEG